MLCVSVNHFLHVDTCSETAQSHTHDLCIIHTYIQVKFANASLTEQSPARAGFTLSGALFRKNVGPFTSKNWRTFLVITVCVSTFSSPEKLATFFAHYSRCSLGDRPLFRACKKFAAPFCGAPFSGAPVRPNMLNMSKSASESSNALQ